MDVVPYWDPATKPITCRATAALVGGRFVSISADLAGDIAGAMPEDGHPSVAHAAAKPVGVAGTDTASGDTVQVFLTGSIVPVIVSAAITAGAQVESGADGRATPLASGVAAGHAWSTAAAAGETIMCKLY